MAAELADLTADLIKDVVARGEHVDAALHRLDEHERRVELELAQHRHRAWEEAHGELLNVLRGGALH